MWTASFGWLLSGSERETVFHCKKKKVGGQLCPRADRRVLIERQDAFSAIQRCDFLAPNWKNPASCIKFTNAANAVALRVL
jgi:hypothetical protein